MSENRTEPPNPQSNLGPNEAQPGVAQQMNHQPSAHADSNQVQHREAENASNEQMNSHYTQQSTGLGQTYFSHPTYPPQHLAMQMPFNPHYQQMYDMPYQPFQQAPFYVDQNGFYNGGYYQNPGYAAPFYNGYGMQQQPYIGPHYQKHYNAGRPRNFTNTSSRRSSFSQYPPPYELILPKNKTQGNQRNFGEKQEQNEEKPCGEMKAGKFDGGNAAKNLAQSSPANLPALNKKNLEPPSVDSIVRAKQMPLKQSGRRNNGQAQRKTVGSKFTFSDFLPDSILNPKKPSVKDNASLNKNAEHKSKVVAGESLTEHDTLKIGEGLLQNNESEQIAETLNLGDSPQDKVVSSLADPIDLKVGGKGVASDSKANNALSSGSNKSKL